MVFTVFFALVGHPCPKRMASKEKGNKNENMLDPDSV